MWRGRILGEVVGGYFIKNGLGSEGPDESLLNSTTEFGGGDFTAPDNSTAVPPSEEVATTLDPCRYSDGGNGVNRLQRHDNVQMRGRTSLQ